ncbi:MAG: acetyl-CoA carboxylase biotin carboxyl carrier protein, partial [Cellulosilyticaceae bacterium]
KSLYRNSESTNQTNSLVASEACSTLSNIENVGQVEKIENTPQHIDEKVEEDFECINSPMVGTFYSAISPEEPPFVVEGQKVSKGKVLCIVEAMKLMNEIVAEFDCEIVSVMAENSKMVEYSQPLFKIRR